MLKLPASALAGWTRNTLGVIVEAISILVFSVLDLLDCVFCIFYRYLDEFLDDDALPCYCGSGGKEGMPAEDAISETLFERKNLFRAMGFLDWRRKLTGVYRKKGAAETPRWSDCRCESCLSWQKTKGKLHVTVGGPPQGPKRRNPAVGNVIFLHGFLSSSSFWTETVFPNLSGAKKREYRFFALDLLGFGRSPKPRDCSYRLEDHLGMIDKSVIEPFELESFHLVAHSMGCIIALALAAKYPNSVKSITLIAPPYFPSSEEKASRIALNRLAGRRVWPPLLFGSSFMSWYEHLGRTVCFLFCRNHRLWEWILKLVTRKRTLHFMTRDLTKHTHHSAWHCMHNVICGGARFMDNYLGVVSKSRVLMTVIQGDKDQVVPLECSHNVKLKVSFAEVKTIPNADHTTVVLGREKDLARDLEVTWDQADIHNRLKM